MTRNMCNWLIVIFVVATLCGSPARASDQDPSNLMGTWRMKFRDAQGEMHDGPTLKFELRDGKLSFVYASGGGSNVQQTVEFQDGELYVKRLSTGICGTHSTLELRGKLDGETLKGKLRAGPTQYVDRMPEREWEAERVPAGAVVGWWQSTVRRPGGETSQMPIFRLELRGNDLTGSLYTPDGIAMAPVTARFQDDELTLSYTRGGVCGNFFYAFKGKLSDGVIRGTGQVRSADRSYVSACEWEAKRLPAPPPLKPKPPERTCKSCACGKGG